MSALLTVLYAVLAGPHLLSLAAEAQRAASRGQALHVRALGSWALALLFVVPTLLALLDHLRRIYVPTPSWLKLTYDPSYPGAWDYAFTNHSECYVRLLTTDGRWIGGWLGPDSWVSGYPEPREVFIEQAHAMDVDGTFGAAIPDSAGLYVRCDDIRLVEFIDPPSVP